MAHGSKGKQYLRWLIEACTWGPYVWWLLGDTGEQHLWWLKGATEGLHLWWFIEVQGTAPVVAHGNTGSVPAVAHGSHRKPALGAWVVALYFAVEVEQTPTAYCRGELALLLFFIYYYYLNINI